MRSVLYVWRSFVRLPVLPASDVRPVFCFRSPCYPLPTFVLSSASGLRVTRFRPSFCPPLPISAPPPLTPGFRKMERVPVNVSDNSSSPLCVLYYGGCYHPEICRLRPVASLLRLVDTLSVYIVPSNRRAIRVAGLRFLVPARRPAIIRGSLRYIANCGSYGHRLRPFRAS